MPVASHKFGFGANAVAGLDDITASLPALNPPIDSGPASASSAPMEEPTAPLEGTHRPRRRWTQDEDAKLIAAVDRFGSQRGPGSQWSKISAGLPGRTNKDCRKRWFHSLDPRVRKGRWSSDEDELLRKLYAELGPQWKSIALRIPGRKDDQVSKRWRDVLAPELTSKKPWSDEEDALLLALLEEKGPKWTAIAEQLPGRSPIACRNRSRKYRKQQPVAPGTAHTDVSTPAGRSESSAQRSSPEQEQDAWGDVDMLLAQHAAEHAAAQHALDNRHQHNNQDNQHQHQNHHQHNHQHHSNAHPPHTGDTEWRLPDLGVADVQGLDLAFNFEVANAPLHAGLGPAAAVTGSEAAEAGFLEGWLASVSGVSNSASGTSSASSATATSRALPNVSSTDSLTTLSANDKPLQVLYGHSELPVNNMWSLLLALDRGERSVTVNSQLLRQLVADGPGKLRQQSLSMELS